MTKLTNEQKQEIILLIKEKEKNLGSMRAVATFLGLSPATVSMMLKNIYATKGDDAWIDTAAKLGWKPKGDFQSGWRLHNTTDMRQIRKVVTDAKQRNMFIAISDLAGIGKTSNLKNVAEELAGAHTYYIRCWEWGKKELLVNVCRHLGIDTGRGVKTPNQYVEMIIAFFQARIMYNPQLILDEIDKLRPGALRAITIPVYNDCEDQMSMIIAGTENLEKEIKNGVRHHVKGYDEIDSRFGRTYLKLLGCTYGEAMDICRLNGLSDETVIKEIFEQCKPVRKEIKVGREIKIVRVITDIRPLKRKVMIHIKKQAA